MHSVGGGFHLAAGSLAIEARSNSQCAFVETPPFFYQPVEMGTFGHREGFALRELSLSVLGLFPREATHNLTGGRPTCGALTPRVTGIPEPNFMS
jgi:hypothetical protein